MHSVQQLEYYQNFDTNKQSVLSHFNSEFSQEHENSKIKPSRSHRTLAIFLVLYNNNYRTFKTDINDFDFRIYLCYTSIELGTLWSGTLEHQCGWNGPLDF